MNVSGSQATVARLPANAASRHRTCHGPAKKPGRSRVLQKASGNVVFCGVGGCRPRRTPRGWDRNPFAAEEARTVHLFFLDTAPGNPDLDALQGLSRDSERWQLSGAVFYLHAPEGIARSRLAAAVERKLGVGATARNWRTTGKVLSLRRRHEGAQRPPRAHPQRRRKLSRGTKLAASGSLEKALSEAVEPRVGPTRPGLCLNGSAVESRHG